MAENLAEAVERNAQATERQAAAVEGLGASQQARFRWLYAGVAVLTAIVVFGLSGLFFYFQGRAGDSERLAQQAIAESNLGFKQSTCFNAVMGNYVKQIGLLADSNGASLRGEPVDPERNRARVVDLRKASEYISAVDRICYTPTPDPTPLDGVLPSGEVIVVPN